jgi:hypothetical protein
MYYQGMKFTRNSTLRDRTVNAWYPCPGCQLHRISKQKRKLLFSRFHPRPQASWLVYWRSHPTEFKEMLEAMGPTRYHATLNIV